MAVPLDVSPVESGSVPDVALAGSGAVEGRSLGQTAWGRLQRDKVAMAGGAIARFRSRASRRYTQRAFGLSGNSLRIALLIFIIGFFNWPYMGRIIRRQTLSLRNREFLDGTRSLGARPGYVHFQIDASPRAGYADL